MYEKTKKPARQDLGLGSWYGDVLGAAGAGLSAYAGYGVQPPTQNYGAGGQAPAQGSAFPILPVALIGVAAVGIIVLATRKK